MHRDRHEYAEASTLYATLVGDEGAKIPPVDRGIAAIDWVYCLFQTGDLDRAYSTCRDSVRLLEPLRNEPYAHAAILELANCGFRVQGLSVRFLADLRKRARSKARSEASPAHED